ncbi:MAG: hypothetical protein AAFY59_14890, partial [Pseudomonadota bacterium]
EDIAEGEQLFQQHREDIAEAVRSGAIPPGASPYVRRGYRKGQLHVLGASYATELNRALEFSDIHTQDDPRAVEDFINQFSESFAERNGIRDQFDATELSEIFTPMQVRANDGFRNKHASRNIKWIGEDRLRVFNAELQTSINLLGFGGNASQAGAAKDQLSQWITAKVAEMQSEGYPPGQINAMIQKSLTDAAVAEGDDDILEVYSNLNLSGRGRLGSTKEGKRAISAAESQIAKDDEAKSRQADTEFEDELKMNAKELEAAAMEAATAHENERFDRIFDRLMQVNPVRARAVHGFKLRVEGEYEDDINGFLYVNTLRQIRQAGTFEEAEEIVMGALAQEPGLFSQRNELLAEAEKRRQGSDTVLERAGSDPVVRQVRSQVEDLVMNASEDDDRAFRAGIELEDAAIEWINENRDPQSGEYSRTALRTHLLGTYKGIAEIYTNPQRSAPEETRLAPPPASASPRPAAPVRAAEAAPAEETLVIPEGVEEVPDWAADAVAEDTVPMPEWAQ